MFGISLASEPKILEEVYKFRYSIYVSEMQRNQDYADHKNKRIITPLDETGINLIATEKGKIVGVVRLNLRKDGDFDYYKSLYQVDAIKEVTLNNSSFTTGLMIDKHYRKSTLAVKICIAGYNYYLQNGIRYMFIDCNDYLVGFFEKLGFLKYMGSAFHKEYGEVYPMLLDTYDEAHLYRVKSPYLKALKNWKKGAMCSDRV